MLFLFFLSVISAQRTLLRSRRLISISRLYGVDVVVLVVFVVVHFVYTRTLHIYIEKKNQFNNVILYVIIP